MYTTHLFVDEAGDTILFGKHGNALVGTEGTSRFFMVGRLEVGDLPMLEADLASLRAELMADPLLNTVPSMLPETGKTRLFFHAKNDIPEVRHAVFKLLRTHDLRFSSVVRDKQVLLKEMRAQMAESSAYRYKADGHQLYDQLSAQLFNRFGQFGSNREVTFAVRGSKPRTEALKSVLDDIDQAFANDFALHRMDKPRCTAGIRAKAQVCKPVTICSGHCSAFMSAVTGGTSQRCGPVLSGCSIWMCPSTSRAGRGRRTRPKRSMKNTR